MNKGCLIIPCYNEANRLDQDSFVSFAKNSNIDLCFVNDGSSDRTSEILHRMSTGIENIYVLDLDQNGGKAEAVRQGFLNSIEKNYEYAGFWDADLATPLTEIGLFQELINKYSVVMGSRILRLGGAIERKWYRHILGRVFATVASLLLSIPVYDTQCGAKFFRLEDCKDAFSQKFSSQWLFDVEILFRLKKNRLGLDKFYEVPLTAWKDESGSKLKIKDFLVAPLELLSMYFRYK